jgi:hypothetical protein
VIAKKIKFKSIILIICFFLEINSLQPAEAIKLGRFECLSDVYIERAYNDNVLLTTERSGSFVSTISPMLSVRGTGSLLDVEASYNAHLTSYERHEYANQNQGDQTGIGNIMIKPTGKTRLGIKGEDTYGFTKRDERDPLMPDNTIKFNDILITPYIEQEIGKRLKTEISCSYAQRKYKQSEDDGDENLEGSKTCTRTIDLHFQLNNGFSLEGGYRYAFNDFAKETPDYTERVAEGGFTWNIESKIRIRARYGRNWQQVADESGQVNSCPTVNSTIDFDLGKSTVVTATYTRSLAHNSSYDTRNDPFTTHDASVTIKHDLLDQKVALNYGGNYNQSNYYSGDRKDKTYRGTANMTWKISNPVLLSLTGDYMKSQYTYDLEKRADKSYDGGGCLELKLSRLLTLSLSGNYTKFRYGPGSYSDRCQLEHRYQLDGSSKLTYRFNKNIFIEAGYQYLKNRSTNQELLQYEEDRSEYVRNMYTSALKATF